MLPKTGRRLTQYLVAAFYILAAVRAVVPNLCQTQRQALEQIQAQSCCSADADCNAPAPLPEGRPGVSEPPKPKIPCAFCLLAATLQEPLTTVHPQPAHAPTATLEFPPTLQAHSRTSIEPWLGRSPPSC